MCVHKLCQLEVSFKVAQVLSVPGVPVRDSMLRNCCEFTWRVPLPGDSSNISKDIADITR